MGIILGGGIMESSTVLRESTELEEARLGPIVRLDLEFGLESDLSDSASTLSSLGLTTSLVLSMLVTEALRSTEAALAWSCLTTMSARLQPY